MHNALHKMNLSTNDYTHINVLIQMKMIKKGAVWRALIIHTKAKIDYKKFKETQWGRTNTQVPS